MVKINTIAKLNFCSILNNWIFIGLPLLLSRTVLNDAMLIKKKSNYI